MAGGLILLGACPLGVVTLEPSFPQVFDVDLARYISAPVMGVKPVKTLMRDQYSGEIVWDPLPVADAFQLDTVYTAKLTLRAAEGYVFTGGEDFFHGGTEEVSVMKVREDRELSLTLRFPPTLRYRPFAGVAGHNDSVVDVIRDYAGQESLTYVLGEGGTETVKLDSFTDFGTAGLVLTPDTSPRNLTLDGGGRTLDLTGASSGRPLITVGDGVTLTLKNITLKGLKAGDPLDTNNNTAPLILVQNGGTLVMESGSQVADNINDGYYPLGGGVSLDRDDEDDDISPIMPKFIMKDGARISGNASYGGGGVHGTGEFIMEGGVISGNHVVSNNSTNFNYQPGEITKQGGYVGIAVPNSPPRRRRGCARRLHHGRRGNQGQHHGGRYPNHRRRCAYHRQILY